MIDFILEFMKISCDLCRQFWKRHTQELFDPVPGRHLGNYWPQQALMPLLPFGKTLGVILNVFLLWRYVFNLIVLSIYAAGISCWLSLLICMATPNPSDEK